MADKKILTEKDIDYLEQRLEEIFPTRDEFKSFRSDVFDKLDEIVGEIRASREERVISSHQLSKLQEKVESLEKIHPQGQHVTL